MCVRGRERVLENVGSDFTADIVAIQRDGRWEECHKVGRPRASESAPRTRDVVPVLQMRDAAFARAGEMLADRLTLEVNDGERVARVSERTRSLGIVALMASGGVKATTGSVFIDGFDPKIQPTQCKRLAG